MFKLPTLGLAFACLVTALATAGGAALIALDFAGVDGLARAWSGLRSGGITEAAAASPPPPDPLAARLQGVGQIDLFTTLDVPGSPIKVTTGTAYANAADLAKGLPSSRWCYAHRGVENSSFQPTVALGRQKATDKPTLFDAATLSADDARHLGVTPAALADLSRRLCRFGG